MKKNPRIILLAGGKGTRNYPQSKGQPHKILLPFGSERMLDHFIEAIASIETNSDEKLPVTILVSNASVEEYIREALSRNLKIEEKFDKVGRGAQAEILRKHAANLEKLDISFVHQTNPKGVGHAIGTVANAFPDEDRSYFTIFSDDIVLPKPGIKNYQNPIKRMYEKYLKEGNEGNLYFVRYLENQDRFGIITDEGRIKQIDCMVTGYSSFYAFILDNEIIKTVAKASLDVEIPGTPEYKLFNEEKKELIQHPYINAAVEKNPSKMKIRRYVLREDEEILFDGGSLQGYQKILLYSLLNNSINEEDNKEFLKTILDS